jgi:hypothetical protein
MNVFNTIINNSDSVSLNKYGIIPDEKTKFLYKNIHESFKNDAGTDIYNHKILQYLIIKSLNNKEYIGTNYGGWFVPNNILDKNSICYCAGFSKDSSFELGLISEYNCYVNILDPLPKAYSNYHSLISFIENRINVNDNVDGYEFWNNIFQKDILDLSKLSFVKYGIYDDDTKISLNININKNSSFVEHVNVDVKKIQSIMYLLKHNKIDLLKLNVGDNACKILNSVLSDGIYPKILCIEFSEFSNYDEASIQIDTENYFNNLKTFCSLIDTLNSNGYKLLDDSRKGKMTFVSKFC